MNTTQTTTATQEAPMTLTARTLSGVKWLEAGKVAGFENTRLYGVTDGAGRWATFGAARPSAWDRKAIAAEIAATVDASGLTWIEAL